MPLKDINCRNAKPQEKTYRLYDEQGLYLEVQPNGGRYWRLKYRFLGREKRLAFGVYPEVGLLDARKKRDAARTQLAAGHDPSLQKRLAKALSQLDHHHTFESVAQQWLTVRESSWAPEYTRTVKQRLEFNAYPPLLTPFSMQDKVAYQRSCVDIRFLLQAGLAVDGVLKDCPLGYWWHCLQVTARARRTTRVSPQFTGGDGRHLFKP